MRGATSSPICLLPAGVYAGVSNSIIVRLFNAII